MKKFLKILLVIVAFLSIIVFSIPDLRGDAGGEVTYNYKDNFQTEILMNRHYTIPYSPERFSVERFVAGDVFIIRYIGIASAICIHPSSISIKGIKYYTDFKKALIKEVYLKDNVLYDLEGNRFAENSEEYALNFDRSSYKVELIDENQSIYVSYVLEDDEVVVKGIHTFKPR